MFKGVSRKPSSVAKGSGGGTRTIGWENRETRFMRNNPIFDEVHNLQTIETTETIEPTETTTNNMMIFSTEEKSFVLIELVVQAIKNLPEWVNKVFENLIVCIALYSSKKYKKEDFPFDGNMSVISPTWFIRNRLKKIPNSSNENFRFMMLFDHTFDTFEDPDNAGELIFAREKSNDGNLLYTFDTELFKHFFQWRREKTKYWFTYTIENHHRYVTEFVLLHELGHLYDKLTNEKFDEETYLQSEINAHKFATKVNPNLSPILDKFLEKHNNN